MRSGGGLEFVLETVDKLGIDLESSGQNGVINRGRGPEQCVGNQLSSWILATALKEAMLSWKCTRPLGNTNTSPFSRFVGINVLLVVMKPTERVPSMTTKISVARGCM